MVEDKKMKKKITINSAQVLDNKLNLMTSETIKGLSPREHMLVDSDQFAFIYIMENADDFTYIVIPELIWPALKGALNGNIQVFLVSGEEQIELVLFHEELKYLINNIRGNGNYGDKMVEKVEVAF